MVSYDETHNFVLRIRFEREQILVIFFGNAYSFTVFDFRLLFSLLFVKFDVIAISTHILLTIMEHILNLLF